MSFVSRSEHEQALLDSTRSNIQEIVGAMGFPYFSYLIHEWPISDDRSGGGLLTDKYSINNLPIDWIETYDTNGWLMADPLFHQLSQTAGFQPAMWNIEDTVGNWETLSRDQKALVRCLKDYGFTAGGGIPYRGPLHAFATFSVLYMGDLRKFSEIWESNVDALFRIGQNMHTMAAEYLGSVPIEDPLTKRQREALTWARDGYKAGEIAEKMGIKQKSAELALQQAAQRLNARNTVNAVSIAISSGIIGVHRSNFESRNRGRGRQDEVLRAGV